MSEMRERTGGGDPQESVRLVWRAELDQPKRRGPVPAFTVDQLVGRAIEIADREGLPALTMRRLADSFGMAPMNIYRYVPGRAVLIDLMFDQICAEASGQDLRKESLADSLMAIAEQNRQLFSAHPWAATVGTARPAVGPGQSRKYETELAAIADRDLEDIDTDAALQVVIGFVRSNFRDAAEQAAAVEESGASDAEWWAANAPLLEELVDPDEFPLATRIGRAAGEAHGSTIDAGFAYRFGLERIIAGIVELAEGGSQTRITSGGSEE